MASELRVFSPSSTETFGKCPRKWALNREGWKPRLIQYPELCAVLGEGFSVAMDVRNRALMNGTEPSIEGIAQAGSTVMELRIATDILAGRRIDEKDLKTFDLLDTYLERAVEMYVNVDPLHDWTLLASEETYPDHGNARLDLRAEDANGVAVLDYKVKIKLDSQWEAKTIAEYADTQQRFHCQWCAQTKRFYIILVVLGPKPYVKVCPYGDSPYFNNGLWFHDSQKTWFGMSQWHGIPSTEMPGSPIHKDQYGPCEYQEACLQHCLDPQLMNVSYVKMERTKPVAIPSPVA